MDTQRTTLGNIGTEDRRRTSSRNESNCPNLRVYTDIFTGLVAHRFLDVTNLNQVDTDEVRRISEFALLSSNILVDTWDRYTREQQSRAA